MVFENVYQMITPPSVVKKSWFVEWFDGDDLRAVWALGQSTGSGAMLDGIDNGYRLTTGTGDGNERSIYFNNIRHYDFNGVEIIAIYQRVDALSFVAVGLADGLDFTATAHSVTSINDTDNTNWVLLTSNGTTSITAGTTAIDTIFHKTRVTFDGTTAQMFLEGILEATKTTDVPSAAMQPLFEVHNRTAAARNGDIRYLEVYNT